METSQYQQPAAPVQPQMDIMPSVPGPTHKKRNILIIFGVIVVIGAGYMLWKHVFNKPKPLTPIEQLQELENTSLPVTETVEERTQELQELEKESAPVNATQEERLRQLQMLSQ